MKKHRGILAVLLVLWSLWAAVAAASPADAQQETSSGIEASTLRYLEDVQLAMLALESYHMDSDIFLQTDALGRVHMQTAGDFRATPKLRYQSDWRVTYEGALLKTAKELRFTQYMEEVGDKLLFYSNMEGQWRYLPIASSDAAKSSTGARNKNRSMKEQLAEAKLRGYDFVKTAAMRKADDGKTMLDITLDMHKIADIVAKEMERLDAKEKARAPKKATEKKQKSEKAAVQQKEQVVFEAKTLRTLLDKTGDLSYTLQIDDATKRIVQMDAEMTEPLRSFMAAFADFVRMSPAERAQWDVFMQGLTMQFTMRMSAFDAVEPFEVPKEVRKNAKPFAMPDKQTKEAPAAAKKASADEK